jgi:fibroblast growth factor receptor 2
MLTNSRLECTLTPTTKTINCISFELFKTQFPIAIFQRDEENAERLQLDNVTYADEGWYTCVAANSLGSTSATAYLNVVEKLPDDNPKITSIKNNEWYGYFVIFLMVFFILALGIMMFGWKKYTKTKKIQRQMERVNQWTKKVIVVQPCVDNGNSAISETLVSFITREAIKT